MGQPEPGRFDLVGRPERAAGTVDINDNKCPSRPLQLLLLQLERYINKLGSAPEIGHSNWLQVDLLHSGRPKPLPIMSHARADLISCWARWEECGRSSVHLSFILAGPCVRDNCLLLSAI